VIATKLFSRKREGMFQQNDARAHDTSKAIIAWLDTNIKHHILPEDVATYNSPDLSPIEKFVWSIMTTAVYADPEPQSLK